MGNIWVLRVKVDSLNVPIYQYIKVYLGYDVLAMLDVKHLSAKYIEIVGRG